MKARLRHGSYRGIVGRPLTVQDLWDSGKAVIDIISRETVDRQTGGVAQQFRHGDLLTLRHAVIGEFPILQVLIDIGVQIQLSILDQSEHAYAVEGFTDGGGLE